VKLRVAGMTALVLVLVTAPLPASAGGVGGSGSGPVGQQTICGLDHRVMQNSSGGVKVVSRPNPFGRNARLCVRLSGSRPGFRIVTSVHFTGSVQAYPFTGVGCAYALCSPGTDLPRRVRSLSPQANTSWTWSGTTSGEWNASYDLWFDRGDQVTTQDNGAELMIWLRTMPGYSRGRFVYVAGRWMKFMNWRTCHVSTCWNYIQFRFLSTVHSVQGLRLWPFIRYAIRHGLIRSRWWLTSVHAGYELWSGGRGLATTWFNAHT
jgi:Glycosyl hydrolase family 12